MSIVDPRTNITHQIQAGQVYTDDRSGDKLQLVYLDEKHVLMKDEDREHARLMLRTDFERDVGAGRYKINGKVEVKADVAHTVIDFTKIDGVGETTARSLQANGYVTAEDIRRADRDELLKVRGVGEGNLANIESYVEQMDGQTAL